MQTLLRDVVFGLRMLVRDRLFSMVAVSMLALGIGANTAIFSVVNAVLLRALPYRDADRLIELYAAEGKNEYRQLFSLDELETFQQRMRTLEGVVAAANQSVNLTGGERPARVRGAFVSANFFDLFRVTPMVGRSFAAGEDQPGAAPVAIVSERLWHERLNSDPTLSNARLTLNGQPHRIIGVMRFVQPFDPEMVDVWLPVSSQSGGRSSRGFIGLGYLAEGHSLAEARAEAATIASALSASDPAAHASRGAKVEYVREYAASRSRPLLLALFAAVAVILLIACANLAQLLFSRGLERRKEFSVRAALGASQWQLVRQLLVEAALLGLAGGALGLVVAHWGLAALLLVPQDFVPIADVTLDARVLLFTLGLSLVTTLLFGLLPALQLSNPELWSFLKEGARGSGGGARWNRVRGAFVVLQVALSLLLLVGATLLFKSFGQLLRVDVGFEPRGLLTMEYRVPPNKYPEPTAQGEIHRRIVEQVRAVPGVRSAALVTGLPFSGNGGLGTVTFPDRPTPPRGQEAKVMIETTTPSYFDTLGVEFIDGRPFDDGDRLDTPLVLIVNETMAQTFWPDQSPLGKTLTWVEDGATGTVVGVVGDTRHWRLDEPPPPHAYVPFAQRPDRFATIVVRTLLEPMTLVESVRQAVWKADPEQPMWKIRTLQSLVERSLSNQKFLVTLIGIFAALALLLTWIGLYGVISYLVDRRTPEIGIRMALGAQAHDVVRMLSRQGMKLVAIGLALGLGAASLMTRFIASLLYGVSATDVPTFVLIAASLLPITWLACYLPARRATAIDPMLALRHE